VSVVPLVVAQERRPSVIAWLFALVVVVFAACSSPTPAAIVRVGTLGSMEELAMFVIQERGLDARHRLRLETTPYPGGARIIDAMAGGSIDFSWSVGTVPLLVAAEQGVVPERAVAVAVNTFADPERPGVAVVAAPSIEGWRALDGALIGVYAVNSLGGAAARARLAREGVRDYRFVEIGMTNLGLALASGTVSAAAMPEPFVTQSILRGDGRLLGWVIGGAPLDRMVYTVITARTAFYREQRPLVTALLRAHLDAVDWINANPGPAGVLVARRLGITDELGRRVHLLRWPRDGRNDPSLFMTMQDVFVQAGVLGAPIPAARVFDVTALDNVLRASRR
jgi:NitT/TauT family transport system substrate-binding protein